MLFKLFVKKIERALGGLSPARRIFLSFAGVIFIGSLLLSLPFVQANGSQATYFDHLFTTVSMVCVTGLFTQPVATTYKCLGSVDLYALDTDWWLRSHDFYRDFLYPRQAKA